MTGAIAVRADTPRRLVYDFAYGSQQNVSSRDASSIDVNDPGVASVHGTSGISNYKGNLDERGTMTVDVLNRQSDGGLVVQVSEQGRGARSAPPAECVVYANTSVICDPNRTVNQEEYTLLRFLGPNFVDPNNLDANKHWRLAQNGGGLDVTADYTIVREAAGIATIDENRAIRRPGAANVTTDVHTKIGYDLAKSLPQTIDEYVIQRQDQGVGGNSTTIYQTSLQLQSDTGAKPG